MMRFLLILAFILQPVVGFGAGVRSTSHDSQGLVEPIVMTTMCRMPTMRMTDDKPCCQPCCHKQSHKRMMMSAENARLCGCIIRNVPVNDSVPSPMHFPVERPTNLRLMNFFSLVSITPFSVVDLSLLPPHGLRASDDDLSCKARSDLDVLAFLCIRLT